MLREQLFAVKLAALLCCAVTLAVAQDATEQVLYNARIFTAEPDRPYAEALAIRGGKIVAVGTREEAAKAAGKNAESVDLHGKWLLPGFIDSHSHSLSGGVSLISADVSDKVQTIDELATFAADAKKSGKGMRGDTLSSPEFP